MHVSMPFRACTPVAYAVHPVLLPAQRSPNTDPLPRRPRPRRPVVRDPRRARAAERQDHIHHAVLLPAARALAGRLAGPAAAERAQPG